MATVVGINQVKLENGTVQSAQQGAWYDGQQYWGGSLSQPGQISPQSDQVGAGQQVSPEVLQATSVQAGLAPGANQQFIQQQQQQQPAQQPTQPTQPGTPSPSAVQGAEDGVPAPQATIDLPAQFESLMQSSGVGDLEDKLAEQTRQFTEAKAQSNDNPFLSEATRVGREAKLQKLFDERTANIRGEIATKRADVETKLNLELKQFDINSQQARDALTQFNTLLGMGALAGASGEDIANITRGTGISSSMIQSAIKASQAEEVDTQVVTSTNNAGVVTATVINKKTGEVINKSSLGAVGKARVAGEEDTEINEQEVKFSLAEDVRTGRGVRDIFAIYSGLLEPDQILQLYNSNSPHGPAKESAQELKALGVDTESFGIF